LETVTLWQRVADARTSIRTDLLHVICVTPRAADAEERKKLHRLGDDPTIATSDERRLGRESDGRPTSGRRLRAPTLGPCVVNPR
jgi:hypothetical protein